MKKKQISKVRTIQYLKLKIQSGLTIKSDRAEEK